MSASASLFRRTPLVLLSSALALAFSLGCSSAPRPAPPDEPILAELTRWLKLDAAQQEKTRRLLQEFDVRYAQMRERWDKKGRVRPEELQESRAIFQRDFLAILTEEQKKLYADAQLKLQTKGSRPWSPR